MEFVKKLRDEYAALYAESEKYVKSLESADSTDEAKKANDERVSKMEGIQKKLDDAKRFANLARDEGKAILLVEPEGKAEYEASRPEIIVGNTPRKIDRAAFKKAANDWFRTGRMDRQFATITTATDGGIFLPVEVGSPVIPVGSNAFRDAHTVWGLPVFTTPSTAKVNLPVLSATAGGVVDEDATDETENEPDATNSIVLECSTFEAGSTYYSNMQLAANDFDLLDATTPALVASKELGLESYVASKIISDYDGSGATITQSVQTATTSTITYANFVSLNRKFPKKYDRFKVIFLSQSAYTTAESLVDSQGRPILTPDAQNQELKRINGTPVLRCDYFQAMGSSGHVVGAIVSMLGFRLRDAGQPQITRYVNQLKRPDQTGINLFAYHAAGYDPDAVCVLKN